jgi:hypothetical protein
MRHVSPQEAAALLSKPKPMLSERQSKIVEFLKRTPDFAMICQGSDEKPGPR